MREREGDDDDVHYYIRWRLKLEGETMMMMGDGEYGRLYDDVYYYIR